MLTNLPIAMRQSLTGFIILFLLHPSFGQDVTKLDVVNGRIASITTHENGAFSQNLPLISFKEQNKKGATTTVLTFNTVKDSSYQFCIKLIITFTNPSAD